MQGVSTSLADLNVLVLDCQATGPNPLRDHLLEIGWARMCARDAQEAVRSALQSFLLRLPEQTVIPGRVKRITGISSSDLGGACRLRCVWEKLAEAACSVTWGRPCPTVIHFSRFEEPFLRRLFCQNSNSSDSSFPFRIICTHEIAKRLLPHLPRRGLRAVAGYFGSSVPELRRSSHHVAATAAVWRSLVELLESERGIQDLDGLSNWLAGTEGASRCGREYPMASSLRLALPHKPGIYRMLRSNGDVLYVGKAGSLKRRVNSYFQKSSRHPERTLEMLTQARRLDVTVTGSALEAALVESDEIKRLSPPYNVALTKRGRKLSYCSRDLLDVTAQPDEAHPVGPLPARRELKLLSRLVQMLDKRPRGTTASLLVGDFPSFESPAEEILQEGLATFRERHATVLGQQASPRALLRLGALLWRQRASAGEESSSEDTSREVGWTPDRVADWVESIILCTTHWMRRARWLCLLSEASVAWELPHAAESVRIVVVLESGEIVTRRNTPPKTAVPRPAGYLKPTLLRQRNFDVSTYDRLTVLTTELRRLIAQDRHVEIHLSPAARLDRRKLAAVLGWV
ncbi:MAG: GIY-YIG nuclease family protein [Acidobacteriota bacterium]